MEKGKHRISGAKAKKYADAFVKRKKSHPNELKGVPEGFLFNAEAVRSLVKPSEAKYFLIKFGWKNTKDVDGVEKEMIAPILMALDGRYEVINPGGTGETPASRALLAPDGEDEGGGFLDEGTPIPPPPPIKL